MSSRRQAIKCKDSENSKDSNNVTQLPAHPAGTATYYTEGNFPLAVPSESRMPIWIRIITHYNTFHPLPMLKLLCIQE
jgi:hypothetical protein